MQTALMLVILAILPVYAQDSCAQGVDVPAVNRTIAAEDLSPGLLNEGVAQEWVRRYNGPGNSTDIARAIAVDGQGNVYVTGESFGDGTNYDYAIVKYNPAGKRLWTRRYNGTGNSDDIPKALAVDGQGNVYVTGWSMGDATSYIDYATVKYDADGNQQWVQRYTGPTYINDEAKALAVDGQGNVYVTGGAVNTGTDWDFATIKYSQ